MTEPGLEFQLQGPTDRRWKDRELLLKVHLYIGLLKKTKKIFQDISFSDASQLNIIDTVSQRSEWFRGITIYTCRCHISHMTAVVFRRNLFFVINLKRLSTKWPFCNQHHIMKTWQLQSSYNTAQVLNSLECRQCIKIIVALNR